MYPTLIKIGSVSISSFSVMVLIAYLVAYYITEKELERRGYDKTLSDQLLIASVIGGLGGAKLLFLYQNATLSDILSQPLRYLSSGYTFLGGLLGAILLVFILSKIRRISFWTLADVSAPGLVLAYGIGRIGCFLVGDDYGTPTDLPWGISFPKGSPPTLQHVHPTQLYDTVLMVILFVFLWRIRKKNHTPGWLSSIMFILLGLERFLMEFIRVTTPSFIPGISQAQLMSLGIILVGVIRLVYITIPEKKGARL